MRVWDVASHQCIRSLRKPCASPVTNVLVLPAPPFLHVSGASRTGGSLVAGGPARESRKQLRPTRLAPLAPLCKFAGPSAALRPWEDGVAIIHGAHGGGVHGLAGCGLPASERLAEASGLAAAVRAMRGELPDDAGAAAGGPRGPLVDLAHASAGAGGIEELEKEAAALKEEVAAWKRKYAELYQVSYDALGLDSAAAS